MKEVFMPSMDELYKMQDMGADIRLYLYAKAIEALCIDYKNYFCKGSILKQEFKYIREDEILSQAICYMYPNELSYSNIARSNAKLAEMLITKGNSPIYNLDVLSRFDNNLMLNNSSVKKIIDILAEELVKEPKYRFEYAKSQVLDDIFMARIDDAFLSFFDKFTTDDIVTKLASIEPYYALGIEDESTRVALLRSSVIDYINRYGFDYFILPAKKEDILTNQTTEVKRLFRCINRK